MSDSSFVLRDQGNDIDLVADTMAEAITEAREETVDAYQADIDGPTEWIDVSVIEVDEDGEEVDCRDITVTVDPEEPECDGEHEHDWRAPYHLVGGIKENPGVWGHGGGVVCTEVCVHCGCKRVTDTWAQRPDSGEQGLTSVEYEEEAYELHTYAVVNADRRVVHVWKDAREEIGCGTRGNALVEQHEDGEDWQVCNEHVDVGDRIDEAGELVDEDEDDAIADEIEELEARLEGLKNDASYWDIRRQHGDKSAAVLDHLRACAEVQDRGENHT